MKKPSLSAIALVLGTAMHSQARPITNPEQNPFYAPTSWPTIHGDARNSDFIPFTTAKQNRIKWQALKGASSVIAPVIGPEGNLYITTGQGVGNSHLHAFDQTGQLLWASKPQQSLDDLDSLAILSAPLVDKDGVVYVSDSNQFWAFYAYGKLKWVSKLPEAGAPFVSSILTQEGLVGGVTTNGKVVFFKREDGSLALPILHLPAGEVPAPRPVPPGLWSGGLVDVSKMPFIVAVVRGEGVQIANTPAVHPRSGRIYVPAAGPKAGDQFTGRFYGIDIVGGQLRIAFATSMGGGSGTSPTISPDGKLVYAVDQQQILYAFDTETGQLRWQSKGAAVVVSPSVGPDGTIYVGNADSERTLMALNQQDGSIKWANQYDDLAATLLPIRNPLPPYFPSGKPIARYDYSTLSVAGNKIWVALNLGYEFVNPQTKAKSIQPVKTILAAIHPQNGFLISYTPLQDTCECAIAISSEGNLYLNQTVWLGSIFFHRINPLLPPEWRIPGQPKAGITALEPESFLELVHQGILWVQELNQLALEELAQGNDAATLTAVQRGLKQLEATTHAVAAAIARQELSAASGEINQRHSLQAADSLETTAAILRQRPINTADKALAVKQLQQAEQALKQSLAALPPLKTRQNQLELLP